jgi:hypothetical protein
MTNFQFPWFSARRNRIASRASQHPAPAGSLGFQKQTLERNDEIKIVGRLDLGMQFPPDKQRRDFVWFLTPWILAPKRLLVELVPKPLHDCFGTKTARCRFGAIHLFRSQQDEWQSRGASVRAQYH